MSTLLKNIDLKTTMSCPAQAREYYQVSSQEKLVDLLSDNRWEPKEVMVLGFGSNTIFQSAVQNVVISCDISGREIVDECADNVSIHFGAGEDWHDCVSWTLEKGYYGLENLALIPGLMGAAPIQNIGAYGVELSDVFESLSCVDIKTADVDECSLEDCQFSYRDSIFKREWLEKKVITGVTLRLSKQAKMSDANSLYPALQSQFASKQGLITPQEIFETVCQIRSSKLPNPLALPNSGSFFKNPIVNESVYQNLKKQHESLVAYEAKGSYKIAAGWLIEQAGLKGFSQKNGIGCYEKQALVVINPNHCTGEEVLAFAKHVQDIVFEKFSVTLEIEPRIY